MLQFCADWVLPIVAPPVRDGWVAVENERIIGLGRRSEIVGRTPPWRTIDLGHVAVLPGLINAHTHLELWWLRGRIPEVGGFLDWIRHVITLQRGREEISDADHARGIAASLAEARRSGTAAVGDISNTLASHTPLAASGVAAVIFLEVIGFQPERAAVLARRAGEKLDGLAWSRSLRGSLAAHAPYSVSPELFRTLRAELDRRGAAPSSVHLAESREELEFLRTGRGAWRELLEEVGAWHPAWRAPESGPVSYVEDCGFLDRRSLVVHGVHLTPSELKRLAQIGATLVVCPRGNIRTAAGAPPIREFFASGVRVAVGTDSLGSVDDLNLFQELAALRRLAPEVPAPSLLESATRLGASALGFGAEFGSIEPGKRAALLEVELPPGVQDVEEYLVSGIGPERIGWLSEDDSDAIV